MNILGTELGRDLLTLSNILFTSEGFRDANHQEQSLNIVFSAGYDASHPLRITHIPDFDLTHWDINRFETPQIGRVKVLGDGIHRRQQVSVKMIYRKQSTLDTDSFDGIAAILIDFERVLPIDRSAETNPLVVIEGAKWNIVRLRSYKSPSAQDMCRIIAYDFSYL